MGKDVRMTLVPAENRGYRELYAFSRGMAEHWTRLAVQVGEPAAGVLERGAGIAEALLEELAPLTAAQGLHGEPAAQGLGGSIGRQRGSVRAKFLERNQAVRFAVGDADSLVTLLGYLAKLSQTSGNADLAEFDVRWEKKIRRLANEARRAAADLGEKPAAAIRPLDESGVGQAAHKVGVVAGTVGEWVDRQAAKRR
jgi:hypothetical protein